MFERLGRLSKYTKQMNNNGIDLLVEAARDICTRKKYRKADGDITPEQFDKGAKTVLGMVENNAARR